MLNTQCCVVLAAERKRAAGAALIVSEPEARTHVRHQPPWLTLILRTFRFASPSFATVIARTPFLNFASILSGRPAAAGSSARTRRRCAPTPGSHAHFPRAAPSSRRQSATSRPRTSHRHLPDRSPADPFDRIDLLRLGLGQRPPGDHDRGRRWIGRKRPASGHNATRRRRMQAPRKLTVGTARRMVGQPNRMLRQSRVRRLR